MIVMIPVQVATTGCFFGEWPAGIDGNKANTSFDKFSTYEVASATMSFAIGLANFFGFVLNIEGLGYFGA